jgi:hypothetical protein
MKNPDVMWNKLSISSKSNLLNLILQMQKLEVLDDTNDEVVVFETLSKEYLIARMK